MTVADDLDGAMSDGALADVVLRIALDGYQGWERPSGVKALRPQGDLR